MARIKNVLALGLRRLRNLLFFIYRWPIIVAILIFKFDQFWFRFLLRPAWLHKPISVSIKSNPTNSDFVGFAYSTLFHDNSRYSVIRLTTRKSNSIHIEGVLVTVDRNLNGKLSSFWLENAEDPRLLLFNDKVYIYIQVARFQEGRVIDCDIYLVDVETKVHHKLIPPFSYSGKNWIPYDKNGSLFFIYSLQPLIVLKIPTKNLDVESIFLTQVFGPVVRELAWGDELGFIGEIRGGTPFLQIDECNYLAFSHITPKGSRKTDHFMGALIYNSNDYLVRHLPITARRNARMFDPFGISIVDDTVQVDYSSSIFTPHWGKMPVASATVIFSKSELLRSVNDDGFELIFD